MTPVPTLVKLLMRLPAKLVLIVFSLATATITEAQAPPSPRQFPQRPNMGNPAAAAKSSPAIPAPPAVPAPTAPASLLDQPPVPAQVHLYAGKLTVNAENSTLSGIMHDITAQTGMTVDGLSKDQRIFGTYGPASPREVLSALLDGMGYNIMIVGDQGNGAPRQLILTPRTGGPSVGGAGNAVGPGRPPMQQSASSGDDDDTAQDPPDSTPMPPRPDVNQEQQQQQPQQPGTQPGQGQVKTPQQMLQELQQMRQQQQQQLQQSNPQ